MGKVQSRDTVLGNKTGLRFLEVELALEFTARILCIQYYSVHSKDKATGHNR